MHAAVAVHDFDDAAKGLGIGKVPRDRVARHYGAVDEERAAAEERRIVASFPGSLNAEDLRRGEAPVDPEREQAVADARLLGEDRHRRHARGAAAAPVLQEEDVLGRKLHLAERVAYLQHLALRAGVVVQESKHGVEAQHAAAIAAVPRRGQVNDEDHVTNTELCERHASPVADDANRVPGEALELEGLVAELHAMVDGRPLAALHGAHHARYPALVAVFQLRRVLA
mmetsp:Transcript_5265/g.14896  ORF Transcript_5265/g.14896 Transcript_5265/m.14896 type:complete len:227 (+) Transcript_5265:402-1082(+)